MNLQQKLKIHCIRKIEDSILRILLAFLLILPTVGLGKVGNPTFNNFWECFAQPSDPNYLFSAVLLDGNGNNIPDDILVTLVLPNNDSIPIKTMRGFLSIDLEGKAAPTDVILLKINHQQIDNTSGNEYFEESFIYKLSIAHNVQEIIPCHIPTHGCTFRQRTVDIVAYRNPFEPVQRETPPLLRPKTPEEQASTKMIRDALHASKDWK